MIVKHWLICSCYRRRSVRVESMFYAVEKQRVELRNDVRSCFADFSVKRKEWRTRKRSATNRKKWVFFCWPREPQTSNGNPCISFPWRILFSFLPFSLPLSLSIHPPRRHSMPVQSVCAHRIGVAYTASIASLKRIRPTHPTDNARFINSCIHVLGWWYSEPTLRGSLVWYQIVEQIEHPESVE